MLSQSCCFCANHVTNHRHCCATDAVGILTRQTSVQNASSSNFDILWFRFGVMRPVQCIRTKFYLYRCVANKCCASGINHFQVYNRSLYARIVNMVPGNLESQDDLVRIISLLSPFSTQFLLSHSTASLGQTALKWAEGRCKTEVVAFLKEPGAWNRARDRFLTKKSLGWFQGQNLIIKFGLMESKT